ncbi:MAG TPA: hypothetical protein VHA07_06435 [Devosia sp.]|nr:hypothetical protein [Devosia sp.]
MRVFLLAALLAALPAAALADCINLPDDAATRYVQNQTALTLCRVTALHDSTLLRARQLQLEAELAALQRNLELEQRMQQTFAAASAAGASSPPMPF